MENNHRFKFIEGSFSPADAKKVLLSLIYQKINYHQIEAFSNTERFGYDPSHSQKRISELSSVYSEVEAIIEFATKNNLKINAHSSIDITLTAAETIAG